MYDKFWHDLTVPQTSSKATLCMVGNIHRHPSKQYQVRMPILSDIFNIIIMNPNWTSPQTKLNLLSAKRTSNAILALRWEALHSNRQGG